MQTCADEALILNNAEVVLSQPVNLYLNVITSHLQHVLSELAAWRGLILRSRCQHFVWTFELLNVWAFVLLSERRRRQYYRVCRRCVIVFSGIVEHVIVDVVVVVVVAGCACLKNSWCVRHLDRTSKAQKSKRRKRPRRRRHRWLHVWWLCLNNTFESLYVVREMQAEGHGLFFMVLHRVSSFTHRRQPWRHAGKQNPRQRGEQPWRHH